MSRPVPVMDLGEPTVYPDVFPSGLVVISQNVSASASAFGAGANSRRNTAARPRSSASMCAHEWCATSRHSKSSVCSASRR
jgi:hypothetical protein